MSRPVRGERLAAKGRPKRQAAKTHFFKYQLAGNPSRAEENALKRALQESLEEQQNGKRGKSINNSINNSTNSSDVSRSNNSSSSNESLGFITSATSVTKRTRSSGSLVNTPVNNNKRARVNLTNGHPQNKCDRNPSVSVKSSTTSPPPTISTRAIKTYSRTLPSSGNEQQPQKKPITDGRILATTTHIITKPTTFENLDSRDNETSQAKGSGQLSLLSKATQTTSVSGKLGLVAVSIPNQDNITQYPKSSVAYTATASSASINTTPNVTLKTLPPPIQDNQYLKFKRESKNYAYVKMTALKVSTQKSPSSNSKSSKKSSPNGVLHNNCANKDSPKAITNGENSSSVVMKPTEISNSTAGTAGAHKYDDRPGSKLDIISTTGNRSPNSVSSKTTSPLPDNGKAPDNISRISNKNSKGAQPSSQVVYKSSIPRNVTDVRVASSLSSRNDCSLDDVDTSDLSKKNQNQADVRVIKKRLPQGSWSLLGVPEEKVIYLRDDEPPRRLICYPAIKHVEGDVIQVRDSVLLRSGARKTDLPYIAKVCSFWEDAETGAVMMSLFWYYRPEHTEEGRKPHHLPDEIFASRHRDVDSVECIEDKCYVLTFNEYCRYRKRCKMEQVNTTWSLTDVTIPVSNESYPRRNRIPDSDVNPELVFCCRQIYDSRMKRLIKNPLINPKYGHI